MIYPKPMQAELTDRTVIFPALSVSGVCSDLMEEAGRILGLGISRAGQGNIRLGIDESIQGIEAYEMTVSDGVIVLNGCSEEAVARGIWTLAEMLRPCGEGWAVPAGTVRDAAFKPMRGVHMFLPAPDETDEFKRFLAMLARLMTLSST